MPNLGQRIVSHRSQLGLSQTAVARRTSLAASYLSRIETGKVQPTVPTAQKIAAALRMSLSELLEPSATERRAKGCPISASGTCLMDLIDPKWELHPAGSGEHYSPRQVRLLNRFAALVREGSPEVVKGLDLMVAALLERTPQPRRRKSSSRRSGSRTAGGHGNPT